MPPMSRRLPAVLILAAALASAQQPPAPKLTGFRVTTEGGVEGTRTYRYDEQGRPIDGAPRADIPRAPAAPGEATRVAEPSTTTAVPSPATNRQLTTADGRPLPFSVTGGTGAKTVDGAVDADSALRDFGRPSDLGDRRFESRMADLTQDPRFSTAERVTLDRWNTTFSALGSRRADLTLEDGLGAEVRPKESIEIQAVDRPTSPWSRVTSTPENWDRRIGESAELAGRRVAREEITTMGTRAVAGEARRLEQLSMQDINRYQFRRARSSEPGLPVVNPSGQGGVRTTAPGR